jgi:hypothetical protein
MISLNWRETRALKAFESRCVLRYHDLPFGVGLKTMRVLVEKGLVELVDENVGEFAKDRSWRLATAPRKGSTSQKG